MILKKYSTLFILLSVTLAIVFGIYTPYLFIKIHFIGELFINLLKLFALPLICSALITSLGSMGSNIGKLKILAKNTIIYMLLSEVIAVTIALLLFNIFNPGFGIDKAIIGGGNYVVDNSKNIGFDNFLLSIIPKNIFDSLARFDLLPVVIFSIIFGIAAASLEGKSKPIIDLFSSIKDVTHRCLGWVMLLAPLGIFALVGNGIADANINGNLQSNLIALLHFVLILLLGFLLHILWQLLLLLLITKNSIKLVFKESIPVFSTAFATSSSVATLPVAFNVADKLGADNNVTRFMLPLCASINIGGMMMYEVAATLFFTQVLGIHLSLGYQILIALSCILGGMAEGGIPETSLVSLVMVFKIANIPLNAISILLPLDRIIDRVRTMVNIFGNLCGVLIVSKITMNKEKGF
jgi:proton glutamate symport protein